MPHLFDRAIWLLPTASLAIGVLVMASSGAAEDDLSLPPTPAEQRFDGRKSVEEFWRSKGASEAAAKGIADRVAVESGFNPGASGDGNSSFGLYQHHAARRDAVMRRLLANAENDQAFADFLGADKTASVHWQEIKSAKDEQTAYLLFTRYFERPAGTPAESSRGSGSPRSSRQQPEPRPAASYQRPVSPACANAGLMVGACMGAAAVVRTPPPAARSCQTMYMGACITSPAGIATMSRLASPAPPMPGSRPYYPQQPAAARTPYTAPSYRPVVPQTNAILALASFFHHHK